MLPEITQNYSNYPYGNYVGNAPVGKVIALNTYKLRMHYCGSVHLVKMTGNDRLFAYCRPKSHPRKLLLTDSDTQIKSQ